MAIAEISGQYRFTGKGPVDAKSLVKTYEELITESTWLSDAGSKTAYNGMIVAVWLNKADTSKNGLYYLFDPNCTSTIKNPDVTVESNWIKIGNTSDVSELASRLTTIEEELSSIKERLDTLESDSDIETFGYRDGFPSEGTPNKLYIAVDEGKSYIWINGAYMVVGGSDDPDVIYGGIAN